ncbi:MAG: RIO1 family regulatory kinase/ATPase [Candidatus Diapherotrites archaeon]
MVYLVENGTQKAALKVARADSSRKFWLQKETDHLRAANEAGVGPKLLGWNAESQAILMEYIEGKTFNKWLEEEISPAQWKKFETALLKQARALDAAGIDHGQLSKRGKNILVRKGLPVIVDFEKASLVRKPHNEGAIQNLLHRNPKSWIAKRVKELNLE